MAMLHTWANELFLCVDENEENTPLPGATVKVKDTSIGTAADCIGNFILTFPAGVARLG